jgi:hypothetical protein
MITRKMNGNKIVVFIMALLIVAYIVPFFVAAVDPRTPSGDGKYLEVAGTTDNATQYNKTDTTPVTAAGSGEPSGDGKYPDVPGAPNNAVQYNKNGTTPKAEMSQVAAGEPALFQYRNMTMLMNCSKTCDVVFNADPDVTPKILGLSVEPNQTVTLTMNMYGSPLQGEQVMERTLNFYLGIEPNAELQLTAQIRLHINQTELSQELNREVNASRLTWMYWNTTQAQWTTVESFIDQNGYLVCNTNHFSTWTVAELADTTEPPTITGQSGIPVEYIYIGAAAIAIVVVVAGVFAYKKRK